MASPTFLAGGHTPNPKDTEWFIEQRILGSLNDGGGGGGGSAPLVYRATVTQANEDVDSGDLVIGDVYEITNYVGDDNFTNVGAAANGNGIIFTATGTTPADWSSQSVLSHKLPPVSTIAANTLGGTPVWTYGSVGNYVLTLSGAFPVGKTTIFLQNSVGSAVMSAIQNDANSFFVRTYFFDSGLGDFNQSDGVLDLSSLMIIVDP